MKLNRVVSSMLKENTGKHMLDSGGAYGRSWERNQNRDFTKEPRATLEFSAYTNKETGETKLGIIPTINLYAWLDDNFTLDKNTDARLQRWIKNHDETWLESLENFAEHDATQMYGGQPALIFNSYNSETDLSQPIQYATYTSKDAEEVWLISVHGGCDIRGGYSKPRAFNPNNEYPSMKVEAIYAGVNGWFFDGWNGWDADDRDQEVQNLWDLPCETQQVEDGAGPDLTLVKEPCVIVCTEGNRHDGKGYLVTYQKDFDLGGQLDLSGAPGYRITLQAEEIEA